MSVDGWFGVEDSLLHVDVGPAARAVQVSCIGQPDQFQ